MEDSSSHFPRSLLIVIQSPVVRAKMQQCLRSLVIALRCSSIQCGISIPLSFVDDVFFMIDEFSNRFGIALAFSIMQCLPAVFVLSFDISSCC